MKYLKDEEKSKHAVLQIFKETNDLLKTNGLNNIKARLYNETKRYCLKNI